MDMSGPGPGDKTNPGWKVTTEGYKQITKAGSTLGLLLLFALGVASFVFLLFLIGQIAQLL